MLCVGGRLVHCKVADVNNQKKYTFSFLSKQTLVVSHHLVGQEVAWFYMMLVPYNESRRESKGNLGFMFCLEALQQDNAV